MPEKGREARRTLPVRVFGVRTSGKRDGLVAGTERDIEPTQHGVNVYKQQFNISIITARVC